MFTKLQILTTAQTMARHAAARQNVVAQNIANADTPGFKARDIASFSQVLATNSSDRHLNATRAGHLTGMTTSGQFEMTQDQHGDMSPDGNSVAIERETLKSIEAERQHSRAITIYQTSLNILRTSIGRGR